MPRSSSKSGVTPDAITCELEVIPGLDAIAVAELSERFRQHAVLLPQLKEGLLLIQYRGAIEALLDLDTVLAVYAQQVFAVPRPKALLGHAALTRLLDLISQVRALHPADAFKTFRLSAAGAESSVLQRLRHEIAQATGLADVAEEGDLLIRLRRPLDGAEGWEVLVRLSPRPLSARAWRVCNLPGALNATVAQAMVRLTHPHADDFVLNLVCGSGTLLVERLERAPVRAAVGCDVDQEALECAHQNLQASGHPQIRLESWDAGALPMPDACVDAVLADLPFGQLVGSHQQNQVLYPRLLREATRVAIAGGLFVAITHEIRLWEQLVGGAADDWSLQAVLPIKLPFGGGHLRPRIYVLRRTTSAVSSSS